MTTMPRLADRITALAGCMDLSGFTPYFSPLMFFSHENLWSTITLIVSLAAILLMILVMVARRRDAWSVGDPIELFVLPADPCRTCCLKQLFGRINLSMHQRMHTSGESASTIAAALGVSRATIYRVLAEQPA